MIFNKLKKIFIIGLLFSLSLGLGTVSVQAAAHKVPVIAVMTDTSHRNGTTYLVCGAATDIIATDIINRLNLTGRIKSPLLGDTMSKITQNTLPLYHVTFFNDYKYNYNIDFVNLKRITRSVYADYILMITSGIDTQSEFLKENWWSKWGISSSDAVSPTYKLTTLVTLIDKRNYSIVWQDLYLRDIKATNNDLGIVQFSPSYAQLSKIKQYSTNMSEYVTNIIDRTVNPWIVPPQKPKAVELKSRFVNEGTKVHYPVVHGEILKKDFDEFKQTTQKNIEKKREQKIQQKHIENVRRLEQKRQADEIKELEQNVQKNERDKKLFESIRNNIEDVSNTLPAPATDDANIKPAVYVQQDSLKVVQPVMNKPDLRAAQAKNMKKTTNAKASKTGKNVKPVVKKQPAKKSDVRPAVYKKDNNKKNLKNVNYIKSKPETQQQTPQPAQKPQLQPQQNIEPQDVPSYNWNLKNIYLKQIGKDPDSGKIIKAETSYRL